MKIRLYRKILIVKPSSLGDIVHSLPFLNSLRSCFPQAEIHWLVARGLEGLLEGHPMVDKYITINKDTWKQIAKTGKTVREFSGLLRVLKAENYDLVIDLQGLLRSGLITMATRAPERIGFSEAREGSRLFYNRKVMGGKDIHAVDRYMKIAGELGCDTRKIIFPFPLMKEALKEVKKLKNDLKDYAVIVPGARWKTKIWPAENFGRLASKLPVPSIIVGSAADRAIAEKVADASEGWAQSLAGRTTLHELIEIMRDARVVISNDSGPMHIAAGFQVPVVALFGPTSPIRTGPYGKTHVIMTGDADCSPCFKKKCKDLKCMNNITVEMILERTKHLMGRSS